jgi:hypothetical protein
MIQENRPVPLKKILTSFVKGTIAFLILAIILLSVAYIAVQISEHSTVIKSNALPKF